MSASRKSPGSRKPARNRPLSSPALPDEFGLMRVGRDAFLHEGQNGLSTRASRYSSCVAESPDPGCAVPYSAKNENHNVRAAEACRHATCGELGRAPKSSAMTGSCRKAATAPRQPVGWTEARNQQLMKIFMAPIWGGARTAKQTAARIQSSLDFVHGFVYKSQSRARGRNAAANQAG